MARIASTLASLSVLACGAIAAPQYVGQPPVLCGNQHTRYRVVEVSKPEYGPTEIVGGSSCPSGETGECQHSQGYEHTVGVSESVGGAVELAQILGLSASYGYSWSTEDTVARGATIVCPAPAKGTFNCGLQVRTQMIRTKGKLNHYDTLFCPSDNDNRWEDFEVVAPYLVKNGPNDAGNTVSSFEPCILSCAGSDRPDDLDCDGVRGARDLGVPFCPGVTEPGKPEFTGGWCTAHITQRQRWQQGVGTKFMFDLNVFDYAGKTIYSKGMQEVDDAGVFSVESVLPHPIKIQTTGEDNDPVTICYADTCFACDDQDGGPHGCTLGNGKENGYDNGSRQGDFGFSC